jgi:hypothetical protein
MGTSEKKKQAPNNNHSEQTGQSSRLSIGNLFWGALLVTIGALALLDNFNVANVAFGELWRLWPLVIIFVGFSILPLKGYARAFIGLALAIVSIGAAIYVTTIYQYTDESREQTVTIEQFDDVETLDVSIRTGAGDLDITSDPEMNELLRAELRSNTAGLAHTSTTSDNTVIVDLSLDTHGRWWRTHWRNDLSVYLSSGLPVDLTVDTGATSISADLTEVQASKVSFSTGASSLELTIGELSPSVTVDVSAGASSVVIHLPRAAGVQLQTTGALSSTDATELNEIRSGTYQSDDYGSTDVIIDITSSISAGSLEIKWY